MRNGPMPALAALLLLLPGLASCGTSAASSTSHFGADSSSVLASETIRPENIFERVAFLSSDELAGRDTPSEGLETAAAYLVSEYEAMGLEPAGERGTFYQRYPFLVRRIGGGSVVEEEAFPPNVAAVVRGSDPQLRNEYVVLSAHFDHVGIGVPVNGDSIYNGADDNGTGTAALLEVAQTFARLPEPPRRSILFLHVSGEEHGLLGSEWFSDNPTVPLDRIVANINVDMIGRNSPDSIVVIGQAYSSLGEVVHRANRENPALGLTVSDDPWPRERFFFRSDHYNFARKGIPAVFFFAGVHEDYHRPSDHVEKIDTDKVARVTRLIFHTVESIANSAQRPRWDPAGLAEVRRLTR
ncbi:MAG TPA: M28 family metallopeptidase [Longimicrobiaceae bacterium]|nr:M28 family metallopeptidase [Longimicrobiaceae bacterium]